MYTQEQLQIIIDAVEKAGSQRKAAKALGTSRHYVDNGMKLAAERGMLGFEPVLPGFRVASVSNGPNGTHITQKPEHGDKFSVPDGQVIKGISALVDSDGREMLKWVKTGKGDVSDTALIDAVRAAFDDYEPSVTPRKTATTRDDIVTVIPLPDVHVGLLAWEEETGGNYDTNIARETMREAITELVEATQPSQHCLILGLGDLLHFDGYEARTERSGNPLDTDSRYPKILREALGLIKFTIDSCLSRHDHVEVRLLAGNHDMRAALAVSLALSEGYQHDARVTIDDSPNYIWFKRYGKVLLGATHGDKAKRDDMPLLMAVDAPQDWAASTRRRVFTGHVHHERVKEVGSVVVETLRSPVAKDAWHSFEGYRAGRSVYGYTFWLDGSRMARQEFEI